MEKTDILIDENAIEMLPVMTLRGLGIFPQMVMSFDVERRRSINAVEAAIRGDRRIFLVAQRDIFKEHPKTGDLYDIGVICTVRQYIKTGENTMRVMFEGLSRAKVISYTEPGRFLRATVTAMETGAERPKTKEDEALLRNAISLFEEYTNLTGKSVPETTVMLSVRGELGYTADYIAQNIDVRFDVKQSILETLDPYDRLYRVCGFLTDELEVLKIDVELHEKLHQSMMRSHRDNILREQLRLIQNELGEDDFSDVEEYRQKIADAHLAQDIEEKLLKETERLAKQPFGSSEASVIRNYLDIVLALPWNESTEERIDLAAARKILDKDHFGLEKVKDRIIEYLAVKKMTPDVNGAILCLVGPPGVGKTSVAISIARALNRKLARMSLGGVHDEAEIRGHRKTYVGAMPGRIINAISQSGSNNPLLLLDEIDKLGSDYRGDPSSALLEALDPEQNTTFRDHFLELPFDLSRVLFITTANTTSTIPRPLLDRMEVIEISSYTDEEKLQIAKQHLLPKQRKKHGLDAKSLRVSDGVMRDIISGYTRESGVRQLERELAALCRKADTKIVSGECESVSIRSSMLEEFLGPRRFKPEQLAGKDAVGVVNGLAWTSVGGEMLEVEAIALEGSGKIELTGNLGNVMKESAHTAISCIRSRYEKLGIDREFYKNRDIHLHFPEGAVPKDGPSAGITIAMAAISALTGIPVKRDLAMTGEITLTGRVLPIGGLKEKTMAALRYGIKTVIIPKENETDLEEIDQTVRRSLVFITASTLDDVIAAALSKPEEKPAEPAEKKPTRRGRAKAENTVRQ